MSATPHAIAGFFGEYRWLSNFWPAQIQFDGATYPTVEHAYQAWKIVPCQRHLIRKAAKPGDAKRLSRTLTMRPEANSWPEKEAAMYAFLLQKFADIGLASRLFETGDAELIEANEWGDVEWGVCRGKGNNRLGKLLMRVRADL